MKVNWNRICMLCVATGGGSVCSIVFQRRHWVYFSVHSTITHELLQLAWWNFARTCTSTTSRTMLNFKVIGQGHVGVFVCVVLRLPVDASVGTLTTSRNLLVIGQRSSSRVFLCVFRLHHHATRGQYLALSKGLSRHCWTCQVQDEVRSALRSYLLRVLSQLLQNELKAIYGSLWYLVNSM